MSAVLQRALAVAVAVAVTVGVGALSRVPYEADAADDAVVRTAWRYRGGRVETCRTLTPEELAELPAHMRREQVCEVRAVPYELTVRIDDVEVVRDTVRSSGARADRPLYVNRDLPVSPGRHRVQVRFARLDPSDADDSGAGAAFTLDEDVQLDAKQVALVTYDDVAEQLVLRGYGGVR